MFQAHVDVRVANQIRKMNTVRTRGVVRDTHCGPISFLGGLAQRLALELIDQLLDCYFLLVPHLFVLAHPAV